MQKSTLIIELMENKLNLLTSHSGNYRYGAAATTAKTKYHTSVVN